MKRLSAVFIATLVMGCDSRIDTESDGDVLTDGAYEAIDYRLTSDNYKKWILAQQALDSAGIRPTERIDVRNVSDEDIARVTRSLESQPSAKTAIESAGLSVRDFVLTTIALAQSWDAVNGPSARVLGARPENLDFLRTQAATDGAISQRPVGTIIDNPPAVDGSDSDSESDSDSDSGRRRGKDKDKGKGYRGRG